MPRVWLTVSDIVCRVPNDTRIESVSRIRAAEISEVSAVIAGSRRSPIVMSIRSTPGGIVSVVETLTPVVDEQAIADNTKRRLPLRMLILNFVSVNLR
jgi:ArsR family metal-binding transcriptional regulator